MHQESDPNSTKVSAKHLINYHVQWIKCQVLYVEEHFRCSLVRTSVRPLPFHGKFFACK